MIPTCKILIGDIREKLRELPDNSVQCVITSPPYWGLRDYGCSGQIGLEETLAEFIDNITECFREVRRVLAEDGTCWVNMGDSYAGSWGAQSRPNGNDIGCTLQGGSMLSARQIKEGPKRTGTCSIKRTGLKPKDLIGQPWRLAFALQEDGWYLRQDIIWSKPNPMPESVTDRCTKAHEYIFLLTKSEQYFYDQQAIREKVSGTANARGNGVNPKAHGANSRMQVDRDPDHQRESNIRSKQNRSFSAAVSGLVDERNKRSVWTVATEAYPGSHYATFPRDLIRPCGADARTHS